TGCATGALLGKQSDSTVQANLEHLFDVRDICIGTVVGHERTKTAEACGDRLAVFRVFTHDTRQAEQLERTIQIQRRRRPALGQGRAARLATFLGGFGFYVWAETTDLQVHRLARDRIDAQLAVATFSGTFGTVGRRDRTGVFAFRIARA